LKSKAAKLAIVATLSLGLGISILSDPITYDGSGVIVAQASKKNKVLRYKKLAKKAVHVSKGNMYSSAKLNKVTHKAKNYKHTTFYRTKQSKIVKANKKTAVYNFIKSSNGKTKGWIWHGYVKNGKAPKASKTVATSAKSTSTSSSVSSSNKISKSKLKKLAATVDSTDNPKAFNNWMINPGKKGSGSLTDSKGHLKVAKGTKLYSLGSSVVVGTLSNGHRMMGITPYPSKYLEVMPGMHSNSETFTNKSNHWVAYYISGTGSANGRAAAPHKGFKGLGDLDQQLLGEFGGMWSTMDASNDSELYNWNSKILLINKKAAEYKA